MPKNKGHTNFYERCDLTKKVYLNTPFIVGLKKETLVQFLFEIAETNTFFNDFFFKDALKEYSGAEE